MRTNHVVCLVALATLAACSENGLNRDDPVVGSPVDGLGPNLDVWADDQTDERPNIGEGGTGSLITGGTPDLWSDDQTDETPNIGEGGSGSIITGGTPNLLDDDPPDDPPDDEQTPRDEGERIDRVVQPAEFLVDVIWVVDNSQSMENDQNSLIAAFPTFIDAFLAMQGIDYRIGVVSTDMDDPTHQGRLEDSDDGLRWLDAETPDPYVVFDQMARLGTLGSWDETGRATTYNALTTHLDGHNAGFLRDDAALAIIIISDENDSGDMYGVNRDPYIDFLKTVKEDPAMVSFSTIVGPTPDGCATADAGPEYEAVRAEIGGLFHSICDADWSQILDELAANAASLRREFFLDEIPIADSIRVRVIEPDGTEIDLGTGDFTYDAVRNSVRLTTYTPGPNAEIFLFYSIDWGAAP